MDQYLFSVDTYVMIWECLNKHFSTEKKEINENLGIIAYKKNGSVIKAVQQEGNKKKEIIFTDPFFGYYCEKEEDRIRISYFNDSASSRSFYITDPIEAFDKHYMMGSLELTLSSSTPHLVYAVEDQDYRFLIRWEEKFISMSSIYGSKTINSILFDSDLNLLKITSGDNSTVILDGNGSVLEHVKEENKRTYFKSEVKIDQKGKLESYSHYYTKINPKNPFKAGFQISCGDNLKIMTYRDGLRSGPYIVLTPDKEIATEGYYISHNGKEYMHGPWRTIEKQELTSQGNFFYGEEINTWLHSLGNEIRVNEYKRVKNGKFFILPLSGSFIDQHT